MVFNQKALSFVFYAVILMLPFRGTSQEAYFVDGFHGGIWGHYPEGYTSYMLSLLDEHPEWKLNLEIEPETWDRARRIDTASYSRMARYLNTPSSENPVEYVNPSYGQSYFYNISGESVIRQFSYGIEMLKEHFPGIAFKTYSTEEPCFTSALPQILKSFGIQYASLKNPNTCWGGYTAAHGGELVNWVGPDGTGIPAVPRYEIESLKPGSTWETIGNANSPEYIHAALDYGITHPIGMCLQDAGWKWGPWLKGEHYKPSTYTTWRNYFENIVDPGASIPDWKFSQEDIRVSLVWGSQVLQKIAQQVRTAENNMVQGEKIASMQYLLQGMDYPENSLDQAWQELLLAQHHDCWIVPYNTSKGTSWAEKVVKWTATANAATTEIKAREKASGETYLKVYNTLGFPRDEFVQLTLPEGYTPAETTVLDSEGKVVDSQAAGTTKVAIRFRAEVPSFGYRTYQLKKGKSDPQDGGLVTTLTSGNLVLESELYRLELDSQSGAITSLIAKKLDHKEYVDTGSGYPFNTLSGNFYEMDGRHSNLEKKAQFRILEEGPHMAQVAVETELVGHPVTQIITLTEGEPRIDFTLSIDWQNNVGIGKFKEKDFESTNLEKAFYNDQYKLLSLFPLNLGEQRLYKNAPYDVLESKLEDTFFDRWDAIKHNIILNWVDITDGKGEYGCALLSDHTTSYTHGKDFPLGLTIQYSGIGLWGRDYRIEGPTKIQYSLIPHKGAWQEAGIWQEGERVNEPLQVLPIEKPSRAKKESLISVGSKDWVLSSVYKEGRDLMVRVFNAGGPQQTADIRFGFDPGQVRLVALNGEETQTLGVEKKQGGHDISLEIPPFGFRTIKLTPP